MMWSNSTRSYRQEAVVTKKGLVGLLLLLIPLSCGAGEQHIVTYSKSIDVVENDNYVFVEGTWRRISARPTITVPQVNSVRIECDKLILRCEEYLAMLLQKSDDPLGKLDGSYLSVHKILFQVIEWSKSTISLRAEQPVADIDIRISLTDRTAERTRRETTGRGSKTADPSLIDRWMLE
jgi:hypothetical protein